MYNIGIDLGGTNIAAGIVDENGQILIKHSVPTYKERPTDEIVADMASLAKKLIAESGLNITEFSSVQCMKMKKQRNCFSISQMTVIFRQIIQQWIWCAFTGTSILSFEPGFFMN